MIDEKYFIYCESACLILTYVQSKKVILKSKLDRYVSNNSLAFSFLHGDDINAFLFELFAIKLQAFDGDSLEIFALYLLSLELDDKLRSNLVITEVNLAHKVVERAFLNGFECLPVVHV